MEINAVVISICSEKPISIIKNTACQASLNKGYTYFYNELKDTLLVYSLDYIFRIRLFFLEVDTSKTLMKISFLSKNEDLLLIRTKEFIDEMNEIIKIPLKQLINLNQN